MKRSKSICTAVLFVSVCVLAASFCARASSGDGRMSWYCKRTKDHTQPTLDSGMEYIEKYGAYYVDREHDHTNPDKVIYLTFDAGYENGNVEKILDVLRDEDVRGAFFVLEHLIKKNTELVVRMADEGHLVCNHTATHKDMSRVRDMDEFAISLPV